MREDSGSGMTSDFKASIAVGGMSEKAIARSESSIQDDELFVLWFLSAFVTEDDQREPG